MPVFYCEVCCNHVDLDYDVEHYDQCPFAEDLDV